MHRTVIRNATVVTMDPSIGTLDCADLLIEDDLIVAIGPELAVTDAESVDAAGMMAIPGMVDTHRHLWHTPFSGMDLGFFGYVVTLLLGARPFFRPRDGYHAVYGGALECLDAGVTTVVAFHDMITTDGHADEAIRGLSDAGLRARFCFGLLGMPDVSKGAATTAEDLIASSDWHLEEARRVRAEVLPSDEALVTMGLAARELEMLPFEATRLELGLARELALPTITLHAGMGAISQGVTWIEQVDRAGMLGPQLLLSHGQGLTDAELDLIAAGGASIAISPESEIAEGTGSITSAALRRGVNISFGVDSTYGIGGDLLRQLQFGIGMARGDNAAVLQEQGVAVADLEPPPGVMLHAATLGGACAVGLQDRIGSLTPGKQADIVLLRTDRIGIRPLTDPEFAVVMLMNAGDVDSVWVAGRRRKRNGVLVDADVAAVNRALDDSREHLDAGLAGIDLAELRRIAAPLLAADES